ncbi:hypothetical protein [Streptomyces tauricus]|uniref:hypothetical protein n=1 Tax=Streptomyces tauricus TaxID=68274 RepID=UPI0022433656|nr:hypothetical protein [Streptomyces tauricus]MCW8103511.1 hypothetical protein [Streptomyces tauricus]
MRLVALPGIISDLSGNGQFTLQDPTSGRIYTYEPPVAAMWIAIRQYDGNVRAAAQRLAFEWNEDEMAIRAEMAQSVSDWLDAGLLKCCDETAVARNYG